MLRTRFSSKLSEQRAGTSRTERVARAIGKWGLSSERRAKDKVRGTRRKHPSHDRIQISRRGTRNHFRRGLRGGSKTPIRSVCQKIQKRTIRGSRNVSYVIQESRNHTGVSPSSGLVRLGLDMPSEQRNQRLPQYNRRKPFAHNEGESFLSLDRFLRVMLPFMDST